MRFSNLDSSSTVGQLQPLPARPFRSRVTYLSTSFFSLCLQAGSVFHEPFASTNARDRSSGANIPKLPRSKSRKHPPPSPLSRACVVFPYVLLLIGIFFPIRMSKISPATNQRAPVNLPQRSAWSKGPPTISSAAASSSPSVASSAAPAATANGYQASHSRRGSAVVSMPQQGTSTLKGAVNVSKAVVQPGR